MKKPQKYISLLSDYGFKVAFGDEKNTLFLRKSIQALIGSDVPIKKVKFLPNEFSGTTIKSKGGSYDLICEDEQGNYFIIEMQKAYYKDFIQRSKFYAFQRFNKLIDKGDFTLRNLPRIFCISILSNRNYPKSELYYHYCTLKNQIGEKIDDQITHIIVEISKFDKKETEIESDLDKLIFLMTNLERIIENELPPFLSENWIKEAVKRLEHVNMTPDQKMFFEMAKVKHGSLRDVMEIEKEDAIKEVEKKKDAVIEKKDAVIEKKDVALSKSAKMLKEKGIGISTIAEITGLSIQEIEQL